MFAVLVAIALGVAVVATATTLQDSGRAPILVNVLLFPGAAAATCIGAGMHDVEGFMLYIFGNILFYCVAVYLLLSLVIRRLSKNVQ